MSNPSTAIGEHGQLSGRLLDACQLQLGIAVTKGARMRRKRLRITGLKHFSDSTPSGLRVVRRSRRDSRLIVKTSPRFTVNWPALASSILEDSGPAFTNRRGGANSPVRSVPMPSASTAKRAREEIKTHATAPRDHEQGLQGRGHRRIPAVCEWHGHVAVQEHDFVTVTARPRTG